MSVQQLSNPTKEGWRTTSLNDLGSCTVVSRHHRIGSIPKAMALPTLLALNSGMVIRSGRTNGQLTPNVLSLMVAFLSL
jgi:hypothetical protein